MLISDFIKKWNNIPDEIGIMQMVAPNSLVWLSRDFKNRKSLVLFSDQEPSLNLRSNSFEIMKQYNGQKWVISIVLINDAEKDVFELLLWDLYEVSLDVFDENEALKILYKRLVNWAKLFENKNVLLSYEKILGLLGELVFIRNVMTHKKSIREIILCWRGPLGEDQDFDFENEWDEIKSIKYGKEKILVSSIEQLDRNDIGYLNIIEFEDSNLLNPSSISLSIVINEIRNIIKNDLDTRLEFDRRLSLLGYFDDSKYMEPCFNLKRIRNYQINDTFPKFKRTDVYSEVINISYSLSISALFQWKGEIYNEY